MFQAPFRHYVLGLLVVGLAISPTTRADDEPLRAVLAGHTDEVNALAFSPDGKTLASAGRDRSVRLWDLTTGKEWAVLKADQQDDAAPAGKCGLAFSPDGKTLASAAGGNVVRLWDPATGKPKAVLEGHTSAIDSLVFSADGAVLASAGFDGVIRLWDTATGRLRGSLKPADGSLRTLVRLAYQEDGKAVISVDSQGLVRVWDVASGKCRVDFRNPGGRALAFSPDGKLGVSPGTRDGGRDGEVRLWDAATGKERGALRVRWYDVMAVAFSRDGKRLAAGTWDGLLYLGDLETGKELAAVRASDSEMTCLAYSADGRMVATSNDRQVRLWDVDKLIALDGPTADPVKRRLRSLYYTVTWGKPAPYGPDSELEVGYGAGHGGTLGWLRFRPAKARVDVLRVEYDDGREAYDSKWPPDRASVTVRRADMTADAYAKLLMELGVVAAATVKPAKRTAGGSFSDHWAHARLSAGGKVRVDLDWAGYVGSASAAEAAKPGAAAGLARSAVDKLAFRKDALTAEERSWASAKFVRDWKKLKGLDSHWWVRERYIETIGVVGDESALPTLRDILSPQLPKDKLRGASDLRCVYQAINAVTRLTKTDVRDKPVEDMDLEKNRRKVLDMLRNRK